MSETVVSILIGTYCVFQAIGVFFISRAIWKLKKAESAAQLAVQKGASHDSRRAR